MADVVAAELLSILDGAEAPWPLDDLLLTLLRVREGVARVQLEEAVNWLLARQLIEVVDDDHFALTAAGAGIARASRRVRRPERRAQRIDEAAAGTGTPDVREWTLSERRWASIVERHRVLRRDRLRARLELIEALLKAADSWDDISATVGGTPDRGSARDALMRDFGFSETEAQHVLDLRLAQQTEQAVASLGQERAALLRDLRALGG